MTPAEVRAARANTPMNTANWRAFCEQQVWPMLFAYPDAFRTTGENTLTASFSFMAPPFADEAFRRWLENVLSTDCVGWNVRVGLFSIIDDIVFGRVHNPALICRVIKITLDERVQ